MNYYSGTKYVLKVVELVFPIPLSSGKETRLYLTATNQRSRKPPGWDSLIYMPAEPTWAIQEVNYVTNEGQLLIGFPDVFAPGYVIPLHGRHREDRRGKPDGLCVCLASRDIRSTVPQGGPSRAVAGERWVNLGQSDKSGLRVDNWGLRFGEGIRDSGFSWHCQDKSRGFRFYVGGFDLS
jgi:hypothetical protein